MSVLDFPTSPTNGQYYNGFIWNAANETWDSSFAPRAATIPISSPNYIINGGFDILQRAQSYTITGSHFTYRTADRWILSCTASGATNIVNSINAFPDTGAIDGQDLRFFMRSNVTSVGTATAYGLVNRIEDVRNLAGRTVTLSFWVRGTQNTTISPFLIQHFGTGGSSDVSIAGANQTITTSWQRKVITFTLPSVTGKTVNNDNSFLQVQLNFNAVTLGTLDIAGVQLEGGDVATDFRRAGGTLQGELDACQRYYFRFTQLTNVRVLGTAYSWNGSETLFTMSLPVNLRTEASGGSMSSVSSALFLGNNTNYTGATLQAIYASTNTLTIAFNLTTPVNQTTLFRPVSGSFFEVTAEL